MASSAAVISCRSALRHAVSPHVRTHCTRRVIAAYHVRKCRSFSSADNIAKEPLTKFVKNLDQYNLAPPPPDILKLKKGQRVVAIGDVHGDLDALVDFLLVARVMDPNSIPPSEQPRWCGGDTICVQMGDVLDRGNDELACLKLLASLSQQAVQEGGALTLLYGNHESLNAVGLFQYANEGGNFEYEREIGSVLDEQLGTEQWRIQFAGHEPARWAALEPGGLLAVPFLSKLRVAVVVGRSVFVHAGLTAKHLREYGGIEGMNQAARDWILQSHYENDNIGHFKSVDEVVAIAQGRALAASSTMPHCLGGGIGNESPVWMRDYSHPNDAIPDNADKVQKMIDEALEELGNGVQRMVMGHTPQLRINAALQGKAWRIDVGASRGIMGGPVEVLEIIHGGEDEDDVLTILTRTGKVDSAERQHGEETTTSSNTFLNSIFGRASD